MGIQEIISESSSRLPADKAILLFLTVVLEEEKSPFLLQFLHPKVFGSMDGFLQELLQVHIHDRRFPLLDGIQSLTCDSSNSSLDDIDGSWILHFLKKEKPCVIGLILKHLPADKVYQILNLMDPKLRSQLPDAESLDQVPSEIIRIVREGFEKNLIAFQKPIPVKKFSFQCIQNLSGYELFNLVRDLGLDLLSLAFQGVNERSLVELVKNLEESEAEVLFEKFNSCRNASRGDIKNAQLELLGLSLDFTNGSDLVLEAGVQRLARSLIKVDDDIIHVLQYKLPLKSGYQLQRYIDDYRSGNVKTNSWQMENAAQKIQEFIVLRMRALSKRGEIDLSKFFLSESELRVA